MRPIRHYEDEIRLELTPLIDVVFLLLTFFIFSMVMMVQANVLPVELVGIGAGAGASDDLPAVVTLDREGQTYFNRQPMTQADLRTQLTELAQQADQPRLYIGIENTGDSLAVVDRGPMLLKLMELVQQAGIKDVAFIGPPPGTGTGSVSKLPGTLPGTLPGALP